MRTRKIVTEIIGFLFVLLWLYAAISKLLEFNTFKAQLGKSPLLTSVAGLVALTLPLTEIGIATLLLIERTQRIGFYASLLLMALFTAYLLVILNFSYHIPCSCGGILGSLGWKEHILFNLFFIVLAIIAIWFKSKRNDSYAVNMNTDQYFNL